MTFEELRKANAERHVEWARGNVLPLSFRGLELAGEAGEACNELKKLERARLGMAGGKEDISNLREELADILICVDLIAMDLDIDLAEVLRHKFNKTSEKYGLSTRL
ncbi:MAG: MazG-like family protein [Planctomycetaceae bacterium]|nr:MazG-like family protein [Planctomycetaceae bacterium]